MADTTVTVDLGLYRLSQWKELAAEDRLELADWIIAMGDRAVVERDLRRRQKAREDRAAQRRGG